eukprot:7474004-Alexandrium_andersonii.AAC.1
MTPPQQRWLGKFKAGDLEGLAPPKASYVPLRGMDARAEDMRDAASYKDRCLTAVGLEQGEEDKERCKRTTNPADLDLL